MGRKIKRSNKKETIQRVALLGLLRKVHLAGAINECVMVLEKGKATIEVVDITNNVVVMANDVKIASEGVSFTVGIGNIDTVAKFLASIDQNKIDVKISKDGDRMILQAGRRRLEYLTSMPNLISTRLRMEDDDTKNYSKQFRGTSKITLVLRTQFVKDLTSYIGLTKSKVVTIECNDESELRFIVGTSTEHNFIIETDPDLIDGEVVDIEFTLQVNGENLAKVLNAMDISDDDMETSYIGLAEDNPIVVVDEEVVWGLTPLEDTEGD